MPFIDVKLIKQLKDMAHEVSRRKFKNGLGQMFTMEIALVKKHYYSGLIKKINRNI